MPAEDFFIRPQWPAPRTIRALSTTRQGGVSAGPYATFNLGAHCGDDVESVAANRKLLIERGKLPEEPLWLRQVHGVRVARVAAPAASEITPPEADAAVTGRPGVVLAVMTADCLPVLLCARDGAEVAAAHAGWRGLAAGVVEHAVAACSAPPGDLLAWLGPAIGPGAFEVGTEVRDRFVADDPGSGVCFAANRPGHFLADLYRLARRRLQRAGVEAVFGGGWCTHGDPARFFSFRRDGECGRMATLIWMAERP